MKKHIFYTLIILFFFGCKEKVAKPIYKNYLFLEYYENMNRIQFIEVSEKLKNERKIGFCKDLDDKIIYKYLSSKDCEVLITFDFNSKQLLNSITLKNAGCLVKNYVKKYKEIKLIDKTAYLIPFFNDKTEINKIHTLLTMSNDDYNSSSLYNNNGVTIYSQVKDESTLDEFKAQLKRDKTNTVLYRSLKSNPSIIRKEKLIIQISESRAVTNKKWKDSIIYSLDIFDIMRNSDESISSYDPRKLSTIAKLYLEESPKRNPVNYYQITRSKWETKKTNQNYFQKLDYDITYKTTWKYDGEIKK